jgi:hypothetical protein
MEIGLPSRLQGFGVANQVCEKRRFKALLEPCFGSTG